MASFKEMLKYLRVRDNLSQAELADKLGVAKSTISMYEVGKREPDFETLEAIADFFNVDMNFLLGKDGSENDHYYLNDETREIARRFLRIRICAPCLRWPVISLRSVLRLILSL